VRGGEGHVELRLRGIDRSIRFEPASIISTPDNLNPCLLWQRLPIDGPGVTYTGAHCHQIGAVVRMLCDDDQATGEKQETLGIIVGFLQETDPVEGHTIYGDRGET
jgi:hypothetical protein